MPKDTLQPSQAKGVYRVKNWPEYNAGLIERGNVTVWMDERMFSPALQTPGQRGRPQVYSDTVIQMLLTLKSVYRLPLRALQGFATSLQRLAMADLAVPNYSTLSRRAKGAARDLAGAAQCGRGRVESSQARLQQAAQLAQNALGPGRQDRAGVRRVDDAPRRD